MTPFRVSVRLALVLCLIFISPSNCKVSWLASIAKNKLVQLREMRDKVVRGNDVTPTTTTTTTTTESAVVKGREMYGGGGGGGYGGGGGGYAMMGMMPSLETSLTTLAFLSFGAFLLSMLLRALNVTTGRRRRDLDFEEGGIYSFSDAARIALDAINNLVFDAELPDCTARALCKTYGHTEATEDGWLGQSPWITRTVVKWLTSETDTHYLSPKWRVFQDALEGRKCESQFSECTGSDADIDAFDDVSGRLGTDRRRDSKWKTYMKKLRSWDPSDWTLGPS